MHDNTPDFSYRRIFCAIFVLALSAFSLFFIAMCAVSSPVNMSANDVQQADTAAFVPSAEESLSVLLIGTQSDETKAPLFLLAGFYPHRGSMPFVCFPPSTAVQGNRNAQTLAEAWQYGGAQVARNALQDTLGLSIDRFICLDAPAFTAATARIGSVEMTLEQPVSLLRDGAEMTLQPGTHRLDGQSILNLLHAQTDTTDRCSLTASIAAELVNQNLLACLSSAPDDIFFAVINTIETDITYNDYDMRRAAASFLARLKDAPAHAVPLRGQQGSDGRYHPDAAFLAELSRWFGPHTAA